MGHSSYYLDHSGKKIRAPSHEGYLNVKRHQGEISRLSNLSSYPACCDSDCSRMCSIRYRIFSSMINCSLSSIRTSLHYLVLSVEVLLDRYSRKEFPRRDRVYAKDPPIRTVLEQQYPFFLESVGSHSRLSLRKNKAALTLDPADQCHLSVGATHQAQPYSNPLTL